MKILFLILFLFANGAGATPAQGLVYSSQFDEGIAIIAVDSDGNVKVEWNYDLARSSKPATKEWTRRLHLSERATATFFKAVGNAVLSKIKVNRAPASSEAAENFMQFRSGVAIRTVNFPASEVPPQLGEIRRQLALIYLSAKKHHP